MINSNTVDKKYNNNKKMSLREWQIRHCYMPSAFYYDFFPKFLIEVGIPKNICLTREGWQPLWDSANEKYRKELDELVKTSRPTISIGNRNVLYVL